jgi:hypothetical protein
LHGHIEIVSLLTEKGADIAMKDEVIDNEYDGNTIPIMLRSGFRISTVQYNAVVAA